MKTELIYEDQGIIVAGKPAGLAAQTSSGFQADMVSELKNYISRRSGNKNPYLALIHRLDQPVEGLLVLAKSQKAAANLSAQLTDNSLRKKYLAVLTGIPAEKSGTRIDYIKKDRMRNLSIVVPETDRDGKRAELSYRVLAQQDSQALAVIEIKTGRHHQIRVQMAHMGCPLLGDMKYGFQDTDENSNLALCACYLEFKNPLTGKRQQFEVKPKNPAFLKFENSW